MSVNSKSSIILQSLYRSLLKQSRIIDQSPIHQCFLISKPRKIYVHEYGVPVNVRLSNTDFEIVEKILNDHCGGEYFAPSLPNQPNKSLEKLIKQYCRFGIPSKYDQYKILDPTQNNMFNKYLELAFYAKKRLSHATNVINKMPSGQQDKFLNAFDAFSISTQSNDDNEDNNKKMSKFTKIPLTQPFSIKSLSPLIFDKKFKSSFKDTKDTKDDDDEEDEQDIITQSQQIERGTILISHPLACLSQNELYRKVIYIIENTPDRIVGITMNSAHSMFDDNARKSTSSRNRSKSNNRISVSNSSEFEYCFRGWKGEWNYVGGPVNDQNCPFCILHENKIFYDKFKQSSSTILDTNNNNNNKPIYWTWVTAENYQGIYHALNQITRIIQYKENNYQTLDNIDNNSDTIDNSEISGNVDDAQIISENKTNDNDDITKDEFYESIINDQDNNFKFFQKYSYWSPEQLLVEIQNNVWFPAKLNDIEEERQLLTLKCPSTKLLNNNKEIKGDYKKQYNKWMWQNLIKGLGNEYVQLSVFPDLNNQQTKEFYNFMDEFHSSWCPEVEPDDNFEDESDEDEEETVF